LQSSNAGHAPRPLTPSSHTLKQRQYEHAPSGAQRDTHPVIDYYTGAIFMDQGGYKKLLENLAANPPSQDEVRLHYQFALSGALSHARFACQLFQKLLTNTTHRSNKWVGTLG